MWSIIMEDMNWYDVWFNECCLKKALGMFDIHNEILQFLKLC